MERVFIYCAGGMGREVAELVKTQYVGREIFFVDDYVEEDCVNGISVIRSNEIYHQVKLDDKVFIANGEPAYRKKIYKELHAKGICNLAIIIADSAEVSSAAQIEESTIINRRAIVSNGCIIRKGGYINKGVILGHDVTLGEYSVVSPGVIIGGYTTVGKGVYIGSGAIIRDRVHIGDNCVIGMGSNVVCDIEDNKVVVGNPAKVIRNNDSGLVFEK